MSGRSRLVGGGKEDRPQHRTCVLIGPPQLQERAPVQTLPVDLGSLLVHDVHVVTSKRLGIRTEVLRIHGNQRVPQPLVRGCVTRKVSERLVRAVSGVHRGHHTLVVGLPVERLHRPEQHLPSCLRAERRQHLRPELDGPIQLEKHPSVSVVRTRPETIRSIQRPHQLVVSLGRLPLLPHRHYHHVGFLPKLHDRITLLRASRRGRPATVRPVHIELGHVRHPCRKWRLIMGTVRRVQVVDERVEIARLLHSPDEVQQCEPAIVLVLEPVHHPVYPVGQTLVGAGLVSVLLAVSGTPRVPPVHHRVPPVMHCRLLRRKCQHVIHPCRNSQLPIVVPERRVRLSVRNQVQHSTTEIRVRLKHPSNCLWIRDVPAHLSEQELDSLERLFELLLVSVGTRLNLRVTGVPRLHHRLHEHPVGVHVLELRLGVRRILLTLLPLLAVGDRTAHPLGGEPTPLFVLRGVQPYELLHRQVWPQLRGRGPQDLVQRDAAHHRHECLTVLPRSGQLVQTRPLRLQLRSDHRSLVMHVRLDRLPQQQLEQRDRSL